MYTEGNKYNFNTSGLTPYGIGTIEFDKNTASYKLRMGFYANESAHLIFFNSLHKDYASALAEMKFIHEGGIAKIYNFFAEVVRVSSSSSFPDRKLVEANTIIISFNLLNTPSKPNLPEDIRDVFRPSEERPTRPTWPIRPSK